MSTQRYMGQGRGLDNVSRNMFQLKICVKRPLEVSRRREVGNFWNLLIFSQNRNVIKMLSLLSCVSVCLFYHQIVQSIKLILFEKGCVCFSRDHKATAEKGLFKSS